MLSPVIHSSRVPSSRDCSSPAVLAVSRTVPIYTLPTYCRLVPYQSRKLYIGDSVCIDAWPPPVNKVNQRLLKQSVDLMSEGRRRSDRAYDAPGC